MAHIEEYRAEGFVVVHKDRQFLPFLCEDKFGYFWGTLTSPRLLVVATKESITEESLRRECKFCDDRCLVDEFKAGKLEVRSIKIHHSWEVGE